MDKLLQKGIPTPDSSTYGVIHQLKQLYDSVRESGDKACKLQLRNYNKTRRDASFKPKDRVWVWQFPQSSSKDKFMAKLTGKWKGPYGVVMKMGPINYKVVMKETGEDVRTVNVCNLKPFYPSAEDLEKQEKRKVLEIFQESYDDEEFLGLSE